MRIDIYKKVNKKEIKLKKEKTDEK